MRKDLSRALDFDTPSTRCCGPIQRPDLLRVSFLNYKGPLLSSHHRPLSSSPHPLVALSRMKAAVFASCLVLGTLVTAAPVAERRHPTSKFTSIVVFGDSFSDNVRFSSRDRPRQLI